MTTARRTPRPMAMNVKPYCQVLNPYTVVNMYGYAAKKANRTENVNAVYRLKSSTIGSVNSMCNGRNKVTVRSIFMRASPFTAV